VLPAYTFPAWPVGLNGEPGALAAPPGVTGFAKLHVFAGAPGLPVVGVSKAAALNDTVEGSNWHRLSP
jgi:hypothetical protein